MSSNASHSHSSSSSYSLADLLDDAVHKLKNSYKHVDSATLSIVWGNTCIFIEEQLVRGKAVAIQGLGTFSYIHKKQDLGNKGVKTTRTPVFVVADAFCAAHDLRKDTTMGNLTASVPFISMNNSLIAAQSDTSRDIVIDFHKDIVRCVGLAVRDKKSISIEVKNIGSLIYSAGTLKATFNSDFIAQIQVAGGGSPSRPSTPSRPMTPSRPLTPPQPAQQQHQQPQQSDELTDLEVINVPARSSISQSLTPVAPLSRAGTPRVDEMGRESSLGRSGPIILPHMENRPKNPYIKIRANSDSALRPLSAFRDRPTDNHYEKSRMDEDSDEEECDDETCEHCLLAAVNARAARLKQAQERQMEEVSLKAQRQALQAIEDKERMADRLLKARREEADMHNRSLLTQKQDHVLKQKNMDFYGDVFYARRPGTPESVKKANMKVALEEQITDKQQKQKQTQVETKKEHEIFHETQKQADERARRLKMDEKQRLKDHSDFLLQQMNQKVTKAKEEPLALGPRFDRSMRPSSSHSTTSSTYAEDAFRPSTAAVEAKRRSFDTNAVDVNKDSIQQRRQKELDAKAAEARQQAEIVKQNLTLKQQREQEEINKKLQMRDALRNAWDSQIQQRRTVTLTEITQSTMPQRASLDLGQMSKEKVKKQCKNCGRGIAKEKPHRRSSGDFRLTDSELVGRKALLLS